jgi:hypothetical protein
MDLTFRTGATALLLLTTTTFQPRVDETRRIGGSGGRRTVTMDCGTSAYIVGITATGGRDGPFGFNLLRKVKFTCRPFTGTTPGASTTETSEAVADKAATDNVGTGSGRCPSGYVIDNLELYAGVFIDRLNTGSCTDPLQNQSFVNVNAGGDGGGRDYVACPAGEALFKVEARVGDAIDSMKGYCRIFTSVASLSVPSQFSATKSPDPSRENPVTVPVNDSRTFLFRISNFTAPFANLQIGVGAETDLAGGAALNPPDFKLELIDPAGAVVASQTYGRQRSELFLLTYRINKNGTWRMRVTNLKKELGALNVTGFVAAGA